MRKISARKIQLAQQHADIALKRGLAIVSRGRELQEYDDIKLQDYGKLIAAYGELIQQAAQLSLLYSQLLQEADDDSKNLYISIVEAHVSASDAHIQAVKIYQEAIKHSHTYGLHLLSNKN